MDPPYSTTIIAADDKHLLVHNNFMLQREKFRRELRDQLILLGADPEWHLEDGDVPETGEFIAAAIIGDKLSIEYDADVLAQADCIPIGQYTEFAVDDRESAAAKSFFVWRWEPQCREMCSKSTKFTLPELTVKEFARGSIEMVVQIIAAIQYEMHSEYIYEHCSNDNVVAGTTEVYALKNTSWAPSGPNIPHEVPLDELSDSSAKNDE